MKTIRCTLAALLVGACNAGFAADMGFLDLSSGSAFFGNTPVSSSGGVFNDTWDFVLPSSGPYTVNISVTAASNGDQDVDFFGITLFQASSFLGFTKLSDDPAETWALASTVRPGTWRLVLTGVNGAGIGSYAGSIAVAPAPVPEPQPSALLLGGLVGLACLLRLKLQRG